MRLSVYTVHKQRIPLLGMIANIFTSFGLFETDVCPRPVSSFFFDSRLSWIREN